MDHNSARLLPFVITPLILLVVILRLRRMSQSRPLKLEWLWIMPAIMLASAAAMLSQMPPKGLDWFWLGLIFTVGAVAGWFRGRMMNITVDPQTHAMNVQASPWALYFLVALFAVRFGLRSVMLQEAQAWHLSVALITDAFVVFAVGMLGVQRLEMAIRGRRLLSEARAARAAGA
ncbi:hypothetical protein C5708_01630 [Caulobacter sp. CCUG 60055]|uniref:CcdC protein domain-containing protein n=1 Tax=Caulobacter sp. CCUG 60055 TaxID=2100090 RepID=UPI001FA70B41|nr:CcdC protein domain-containing protein [Caulobacter sp. CCUG 60055]MCI3178949.1 hypothetical protein [Caulobacter sp. CCUG 60055]